MSTFTLPHHNILVTLPEGLSQSQLLTFKPFNTWIKTLTTSLALQSSPNHPFHSSPYTIKSITIQSYDLFSTSHIGFVKLTATVKNIQDEHLPAAALLRGPSVAILAMLIPIDSPSERHVLLTVQPRIPAGSLAFVEIPAGMVDQGTFNGAAAKEIEEELGITISEDELTCLSELATPSDGEGLAKGAFSSAGGCDEYVTLYSFEKYIPREQLKEWSGRLTGLRAHGEKITLKVVPMENLWTEAARDAKALSALALWEGLRREGKI